jgi:MFS family permease
LFGIAVGTWISRIPTIKDNLALDNRTLGLALLGWPLGSIVASLVVVRALAATGSRPFITFGALTSAGALVLPGLAHSAWQLAGAVFVFGLTTGVLDIASNTHAAAVEVAHDRSVFARLHASWSAGAFIGGGAGALAAAADVDVRAHFAVAAAVIGVGSLVSRVALLPAAADRLTTSGGPTARGWSLRPAVLLLGMVALSGFVVEAAIGDWGAVYLHESIGTTVAVGAAGYATFAGTHLLGRAFGDALLTRVDRRVVMQVGCLIAAAGYALVVGMPNVVAVFVGFAVIAAGIAVVVPAAFGAAGRVEGVGAAAGVATVTGVSYVGWAAAPPLIGVLAGHFSLRAALVLPLVLAVVGALSAHLLEHRVTLVGDDGAHANTTTSR